MLDSGKLKLMYLRLSKEDDDIAGKGQESFSISNMLNRIQSLGITATLKKSLMMAILEQILTAQERHAF